RSPSRSGWSERPADAPPAVRVRADRGPVSEEALAAQLAALCRARTGDPAASAGEVARLPGHAGFSYSFTLRALGARERLVLRLAPPGVRVHGTADVARQARLMSSLGLHGVPVPPVRWYGDEPDWFGRPY